MRSSSRICEEQILYLGSLARQYFTLKGQLYVKANDTGKWNLKWAALYQNFIFLFDNEESAKVTGVVLLEHSTCEHTCVVNAKDSENQNCFTVYIPLGDNLKQTITLRSSTEKQCTAWIENIRKSSFSEVKSTMNEVDEKYNHLVQVMESEKTAKWQLMQHCDDQAETIAILRAEIATLRQKKSDVDKEEESEEIKSIKKVQSMVRGWLCRRRWHSIVQDYIRSPHAESMRKRNTICFSLVETEEEYLENLATLVSCFYRPFKMAASSKRPPVTHEEVNSIFLNSETILFLHQIFLKGLNTRMESWPTLILGDLFDMLLPMLSIYQEYVRNHHYSLQTLTECKQRASFNRLLKLYEEKPVCEGRTLETFLTYPMHRVPQYIITLHELLSLTPHDHVERNALEYAQSILEDLSTVMHDEVSETENIRKNLSIERQIAEGCEMLLDVNQIFIRQGSLIQVTESRKGKTFGGISLKSSETRKESVRQCFLFSSYLLLTTRSSSGRLHLGKNHSVVSLVDATLVDDCFDEDVLDGEILCGVRSAQDLTDLDDLTFKLIVKSRDKDGCHMTITLVAPTAQEKAAWTSDISQCIENLSLVEDADTVSVASRQSLASVRYEFYDDHDIFHVPIRVRKPDHIYKSDIRLFSDDIDIKYCKALNSCKLPKIRYAKLERLFERLLDIRFLSIDFLNTFLITYRVFTHATNLLDTLIQFYYTRNTRDTPSPLSDVFSPIARKARSVSLPSDRSNEKRKGLRNRDKKTSPQEISITVSGAKMTTSKDSEISSTYEPEKSPSRLMPTSYHTYRRHSSPSALGDTAAFDFPVVADDVQSPTYEESRDGKPRNQSSPFLTCGKIRSRAQSTCNETVERPSYCISSSSSDEETDSQFELQDPPKLLRTRHRACSSGQILVTSPTVDEDSGSEMHNDPFSPSSSLTAPPLITGSTSSHCLRQTPPDNDNTVEKAKNKVLSIMGLASEADKGQDESPSVPPLVAEEDVTLSPELPRASLSNRRPSSPSRFAKLVKESEGRLSGRSSPRRPSSPSLQTQDRRPSLSMSPLNSPRSPRSPISPSANSVNAGVVVTSSKPSRRRSSISQAAAAFAAATAGASPSPSYGGSSPTIQRFRFGLTVRHILSHDTHLATMRVLTVLRHWVTKHPEDFESDTLLREQLVSFMEEILHHDSSSNLEQKFAAAIIRTLERKPENSNFENLLLKQPSQIDPNSFDKISATQLAEQLTFIEHQLFSRIPAHEFLNLAWMKSNKNILAPNILRVSHRFNEASALVSSEILKRQTPSARATVIEKWANVAEVCRNLHNFNSVLEITSAFLSSPVFRLKKTWEKVSKQARSQIYKLQKIVSSEGRFKNMRDALRCADPPCVPYLGFYLTDLAFIEDGTPDCNEEGLINFSKMRMIAQVIQEIRHYQQTTYSIECDSKVVHYLMAKDLLMDEETLYKTSLLLEPRKKGSSTKIKTIPETVPSP